MITQEGVSVTTLLQRLRAREDVDWDAFGEWVLMGSVPLDDEGWSFRTGSIEVVKTGDAPGQMVIDLLDTVYPLREKAAGAFRKTLLIGRATSNDVRVVHPSVSKLHARLDLGKTPPEIADAGSHNGTQLNSTALEPNARHPVVPGDFIDVGDIGLRVVDVADLKAALRRMVAA